MRRATAEKRAFVDRAAEFMSANMTGAEARLWEVLKPLGFWAQYPVYGATKNGGEWQYVLDFVHLGSRLCVEVDGGVHARTKGHDRRRDTRLAGMGIRTLRYKNREVLKDLDAVKASIILAMEGCDGQS